MVPSSELILEVTKEDTFRLYLLVQRTIHFYFWTIASTGQNLSTLHATLTCTCARAALQCSFPLALGAGLCS